MKRTLRNYYFTYGTDYNYPYQSGWTRILAPTRPCAIALFRAYHPDIFLDTINCAGIYDEEEFKDTSMYKHGNFGAKENEAIVVGHFYIAPF